MIICLVLWTAITWVAFNKFGFAGFLLMIAVMIFVFLYLLVELLLRSVNQKHTDTMNFEQILNVVGFYTALQPKIPLFQLGRFAVAPDTAALYMHLLQLHKPETIVELGSGTSTIISGYMCQRNGKGRVIAIDDDEHWTQDTRNMLETHGLGENIEVRYAPLVPVEIDGRKFNWYDPKVLEDIKKIDLLLVDGPKDSLDAGNRNPALDLLADRLSENAIVLADDTDRPKWKKKVYEWGEKNGFEVDAPYPNMHETLILKRKK
ncbi:MAG: class I SAM-dependent methyltransferase [Candidatus Electryonea clarkiae]|nr:class I SAM-dependent methyltransferase [Candidatus Electryonea clarkiae]MDP8286725.1 class I SAM-dependent methyltransferase [Candidatus Electryonea clarkiae]